MISIYLECEASEVDALVAELHERGTLGVMELGTGLRAWFDDDADVRDFIEARDAELIVQEDEDWVRRTEESFPPLALGERFWLAPPWNGAAPPPGRIRLEINPGLACGTGWHPCTQMCLEMLERYVAPGRRVLDVGAGSGILSAAAVLLGAGRVVGCDVDTNAAAIARERVGDRVFAGSADAVRDGSFDVVVANISASAIESLWPDLHRVCAAGGVMVLSGFQTAPELTGVIERIHRDGWCCLVCRAE